MAIMLLGGSRSTGYQTRGRVVYIHGKPGICGKGSDDRQAACMVASMGGGGGGVDAGIAVTT